MFFGHAWGFTGVGMEQIGLQQLQGLVFLFVGLVFVILVALVAYVVFANRRQRAKAAQMYEEESTELRPAHRVTGQILALAREEVGGPLQVEINGISYRNLADIEDLQVRRQVVESAMELIQFTGVLGPAAVAPASLEKTYSWREDLRESSQDELDRIQTRPTGAGAGPQTPPVPEEVEERFLNMLAEMGQPRTQPEKPSLASSLQHALRPKSPDSDQSRTFVDDIEDIIQRRIQLIPAMQGRGLHVRPGPAGAVHFMFEGQEYEGLRDIPNLTARQLIKDAIREWDETA